MSEFKSLAEQYREEGRQIGFEEGREEGREEVLPQLVTRMHAKGMAFDAIGRFCAISIEEVARLVRVEVT